ncbi:MAG TPA: hypothetical protein EYN67_06080, partial [Flavobacteriales bacterium]|nr:hypothetical protein [Flavobacteriales bacterium]
MSAAQIQKRIQAGLKRAQKKTGSPTADKVFLVSKIVTAGTPLVPGTTTSTNIELVNAIFIDYEAKHFDINILAGDRKLICDNVTIVKQGDEITQGSLTYYVVSLGIIAPTSDVLAYINKV